MFSNHNHLIQCIFLSAVGLLMLALDVYLMRRA